MAAEPEPIPEGEPRPEGAVTRLIGYFDLEGNWSSVPVSGGAFHMDFYDSAGDLVASAHGVHRD